MGGYNWFRVVLGAAAAMLAVGCHGMPRVQSPIVFASKTAGKSDPRSPDNPTSRGAPSGGVTPAGGPIPGNGPPPGYLPPVGADDPTLPLPRPTDPRPQTGAQPGLLPGLPPQGDPHSRGTPTAGGSRLNLAPWEYPPDRALELSRQLEMAAAQIRELVARVKELEALGMRREQALAEAVREVDAASEEIVRARALIQSLRTDLAATRKKLADVEQEDVELFADLIAALRKLVPPTGRGS